MYFVIFLPPQSALKDMADQHGFKTFYKLLEVCTNFFIFFIRFTVITSVIWHVFVIKVKWLKYKAFDCYLTCCRIQRWSKKYRTLSTSRSRCSCRQTPPWQLYLKHKRTSCMACITELNWWSISSITSSETKRWDGRISVLPKFQIILKNTNMIGLEERKSFLMFLVKVPSAEVVHFDSLKTLQGSDVSVSCAGEDYIVSEQGNKVPFKQFIELNLSSIAL